MDDTRMAVIKALHRTERDNGYSNLVLGSVLTDLSADSRSRAFAATLFYGVLERKLTLDYFISAACKIPFKKLSPAVVDCLRTGIYQIKFMNVPDSAAVNETVKIAKKLCPSAAGLINAVLRRVAAEDIPLPSGKTVKDISIKYSCAEWIVAELVRDLGVDTAEAFLDSSLGTPPVFLRTNTLKATDDELIRQLSDRGISAESCGIDGALKVTSAGDLTEIDLFADGLFHIEDLAAQWAVKCLDPKPGERVLDMCAAPGGKSFTAAERMKNSGEIVACDIHEHRVGLIKNGAERLGLNNITTRVMDSTVFDASLGLFDRVICDVPCTGIGIIRRKPDIKYKDESLDGLADLQYGLIKTAARYLKSGGRLVYSTCTLRSAENGGIVERFLSGHPDFCRADVEVFGEIGEKTFLTQTDGTDGFYICVLEKR